MTASQPDTPVQNSDTLAAARIRQHQVGSVGAWFLRVRPWIVAPPAIGGLVVLSQHGAPAARLWSLAVVQVAMLGFFFAEAWWLSRQGADRFVTERQFSRSLFITLAGIAVVCGLTGAWRSPFLPVLLAPTGVCFAAFGVRPWGIRMLVALVVVVAAQVGVAQVETWGPLPSSVLAALGSMAILVTAVLLLAGVAGLTEAHRRTAERLDTMRRAVVEESSLRVRDLEAVGARVAHDLRNPLATVTSLLQLLARADLDDKHLKRLRVALDEAERIDRILGDYLTLAAPLRDLELERTNVTELVRSVARSMEPTAAERDIALELDVPAESLHLVVDRHRIRDALLNLASNAAQASEPGDTITLALETSDTGVDILVTDTGSGMSDDVMAKLGTPFFTTRDEGTGLGVASARSAARQHGGTLDYDSVHQQGTTARLRLPHATAQREVA